MMWLWYPDRDCSAMKWALYKTHCHDLVSDLTAFRKSWSLSMHLADLSRPEQSSHKCSLCPVNVLIYKTFRNVFIPACVFLTWFRVLTLSGVLVAFVCKCRLKFEIFTLHHNIDDFCIFRRHRYVLNRSGNILTESCQHWSNSKEMATVFRSPRWLVMIIKLPMAFSCRHEENSFSIYRSPSYGLLPFTSALVCDHLTKGVQLIFQ